MERGRLAEEMDGKESFGPRGNFSGDLLRIEVECARVDVGEHDSCPHLVDRFCRGDVGKGGGDDLATGANVQRSQGQGEGVRAGVHADAEASSCKSSHLLLEGDHVWSEHIVAASQNLFNNRQQFGFEIAELRGQIQKWDLHESHDNRKLERSGMELWVSQSRL